MDLHTLHIEHAVLLGVYTLLTVVNSCIHKGVRGIHWFSAYNAFLVIAEIRAKAGHEEDLRVMLHKLVAPSRPRPGVSSTTCSKTSRSRAVFPTYEEWAKIEDLHYHLEGEGTKAALEKAKPLLEEEMKLTVFRKLL